MGRVRKQIRMNETVVRSVANYAQGYTKGAFRYGASHGSQGPDMKYTDGVRDTLVWHGEPRSAAAYYAGAILGWYDATRIPLPYGVREYVDAIRDSYWGKVREHDWQREGYVDAVRRAQKEGYTRDDMDD